MSHYYTRKGDDGLTTWIGKGRLKKFDLRIETLGSVDEASATLGLARGLSTNPRIKDVLLHIQRDLSAMMAEIAADPQEAVKFRTTDEEKVAWLEEQADAIMESVEAPASFVMSGDTAGGGALDMCRASVRRAERRVVELSETRGVENPALVAYLNRLSSMLFVLELLEIQSAGLSSPSQAAKLIRK
ncbi:MAG: cob(I)yrinic acid a,c-diamide adenosyltransferase [Leptolinea sp.]|jgi:cob(I)alamin adenosyltransferase|nr:cob(I)yrinic acid a,c-diamide adenosyltransferase [Leptolinea sp.]